MGQEIKRWKRRKDALKAVDQLEARRDNVLLIHYSCESFYDTQDGRTARVTSIAVRNLSTGQTSSFSIHKSAEEMGATNQEIDGRYDEFEKNMLKEFFDFIKSRHGYTFVHWNMRDINYGFQAIEHRFRVLGGEAFVVDDARKFDLARALVSIYGVNYIGHKPSGRLHNLIELNRITERDILTGAEEAAAFEDKEFVKLHQSTLRKVDIMANIFERLVDGTLKTNASWWDTHGVHPSIILEVITKHWAWILFGLVATIGTFVMRVMGLF